MNLVPHLEQITNKWPWCRARRRGVFHLVQLGVMVQVEEGSVALTAPECHQEQGEKTQSNSDTRQRGTSDLLDG